MELMQLEMFVAVVEERSFQRAAERVFRTQPAVSTGVQKLEESVGASLIDRTQRQGGRLTPAGELLYECASRMLGLRDEALSVLKAKDEESSCGASLRIGVTSLDDFESVPRLTRLFHTENPKIRLEISCNCLVNLLSELGDRRMDILLLSGRPKTGVQNKNVVVTRRKGSRAQEWFWTVRPRLGFSRLGYAFEESLQRPTKAAASSREVRRTELRIHSSAKAS